MSYHPENPLIVQSDRTILLETEHPDFIEVRNQLMAFAELVKSPEYVHTYRITPLSLWNAAAAGLDVQRIIAFLTRYSKFEVPASLIREIEASISRYGMLRLEQREKQLVLVGKDALIIDEVSTYPIIKRLGARRVDQDTLWIPQQMRGRIKQELLKIGYPVEDWAGYSSGEPLPIRLLPVSHNGNPFSLRDYQQEAVTAFYKEGSVSGGSGVLVLPCGAGKTIIGLAVMEQVGRATLILTPNHTSVQQWIRELREKTDLPEDRIGQYTGDRKEVRPITVATYQVLTHRSKEEGAFTHMNLFQERDWGLVIYDEVHLLPAPVFRATAALQAKRRLGLTATLVREDGLEEDVFTLIGPKKYDVPWRELESKGWIAKAECMEIRTPMSPSLRRRYTEASKRQRYRIAAENSDKLAVIQAILRQHAGEQILIIGQYISQLKGISSLLEAPLITGKTPQAERDILYERFRQREIPVLVVSKVANFAVDLPDASVAIQVSGTYGSRQEEAQRLGRILRPKEERNTAYFYQVVTRDTVDQEYAASRQLFLVEQGYQYHIMDAEAWG